MLSQLASGRRPLPQRPGAIHTGTLDVGAKTGSHAVLVDLGKYSVSQLMARRPAEFDAVAAGAKIELRFPPGMKRLPAWLDGMTPCVVRLPDYRGRDVVAPHRMSLLEVGGSTVRSVRAREGCNVSVPDVGHVEPVRVEWVDSRRRVVRTGHPQNHVNRAAPEPADATMPRNGRVKFTARWHEGDPIVCRHIATALDGHQTSADESGSEEADAVRKPTLPVDRHAAYARRKFASASTLQAAIPYSYDAKYYDLISGSRRLTIVASRVFRSWATTQFKRMKQPDTRTYLLRAKNHAMNLVLTTRVGSKGSPTYEAMLKDPNRLAAPSSFETTDLDDVCAWSLERLVDPKLKASYFAPKDAENTVLLARTPRGKEKTTFGLRQRTAHPAPRLHFFPASIPAAGNDHRFHGELGAYLSRTYPHLAGVPRGDAYKRLAHQGQIAFRFANGDAAQITDFFAVVDRLLKRGELTPGQAVRLTGVDGGEYAAVRAVVEGRPEALERYTEGLKTMIQEGTLTSKYSDWFKPLFDGYATDVMKTLSHSGSSLQKKAAQQYAALQRLVEERINRIEPAPAIRL